MQTQENYWSTRAQFRRVIKTDTRTAGIDMVFSIVYIITSLYLLELSPRSNVHLIVTPFVALALIMVYFAMRLCGLEGNEKTAMFFDNLPRRRGIAFCAHAIWLAGFALMMELLIGAGMLLSLNRLPNERYIAMPHLLVIPFFTVALVLWMIYRGKGPFEVLTSFVAQVAAAFGVGYMAIYDYQLHSRLPGPKNLTPIDGFILVLGLLTALLFWRGTTLRELRPMASGLAGRLPALRHPAA